MISDYEFVYPIWKYFEKYGRLNEYYYIRDNANMKASEACLKCDIKNRCVMYSIIFRNVMKLLTINLLNLLEEDKELLSSMNNTMNLT